MQALRPEGDYFKQGGCVSGPGNRETPLGWHVISGEDLLAMLRRVAGGDDPDMVYAEEYANAERQEVEDG